MLASIDTIGVSYSYQFGQGHTKTSKQERKELPSNWDSVFILSPKRIGNEVSLWGKEIRRKLSTACPDFPYVEVDWDSDFGYQAIFLRLSKEPRLEEPDEVEADE